MALREIPPSGLRIGTIQIREENQATALRAGQLQEWSLSRIISARIWLKGHWGARDPNSAKRRNDKSPLSGLLSALRVHFALKPYDISE
jgi:hypothetical protein